MSSSPTTFALLGLLASRSWTGYELTRQVSRSLRFVWSTSEGHLYREQKRLVTLGWAKVEQEQVGRRHRNRYTITESGLAALREWQATPPEEPHLQIEGVLRAFHADRADPADLQSGMESTARAAGEMLAELRGYVGEYLAEGGPLEMLEQRVGGPGERREFGGRAMFPERLPGVAMSVDVTTRLLEVVERFFDSEAEELADWYAEDPGAAAARTRTRLEGILARAEEPARRD